MLWHKIVIPVTWETEAGGGRVLGPRGLYSWTPPQHEAPCLQRVEIFCAVFKLLVYYELMTSPKPVACATFVICHSLLFSLRL